MNPIMVLRKICDEGNYIGFGRIEVLQLNYDGRGGALLVADGDPMSPSGDDLDFVVLGDPGSGTRYYEMKLCAPEPA